MALRYSVSRRSDLVNIEWAATDLLNMSLWIESIKSRWPCRAVATGGSGVTSAPLEFTGFEKLCLVTSNQRQKHHKCIQFTALVGPHYSLFSGKIPLIFMCQNSLQN